jgi:hypothetical protein
MKREFPQSVSANLETSCLLQIGESSWKLQLRCSCQFPWCALALRVFKKITAKIEWPNPL